MINNRLVYISGMLSGICLIILAYLPNLDIAFSQLFYDDRGFIYSHNIFVRFFYYFIPPSTIIVLGGCTVLLVVKYLKHKPMSWIIYLLLVVLIGPGIITNFVLKSNIGRARPSQITEFGGSKLFAPVFSISHECQDNCSFPSGHSAMAYSYTSLAYILAYRHKNKEKKYFSMFYLVGLIFGSLTGFSRILMGGHFLSDVMASCFIILIINHLVYLLWKR